MALKIMNLTILASNSIVNVLTGTLILVLVVLRSGLPKRMGDELGELHLPYQ
jgi:hypothetical protein